MDDTDTRETAIPTGAFSSVPVELTVAVGVARPTIGDLMEFDRGRIIPLDRKIDDPVRLFVGDRLIGTGELEEIEEGSGRIGVRILELGDDIAPRQG